MESKKIEKRTKKLNFIRTLHSENVLAMDEIKQNVSSHHKLLVLKY